MSTLALTQCWYTRAHRPLQIPREAVEGAFYAYCRHCRRPIFSQDGRFWHIDGGFNIETLGDLANSFLSVEDIADGMTIARFPLSPDADEAEVEALKEQITKDFGIGEEDNALTIRDHRLHKPPLVHKAARARKSPPGGSAAA